MKNTEKLIAEIKKHSILKEGQVSTTTDGEKYRYDYYNLKYKYSAYWMAELFRKSAEENGRKHSNQFQYKDIEKDEYFSFYFDRAKFKGERDGKVSMSELIKL